MKKIVMSAAQVSSMFAGNAALAQEENTFDGVVSILRISNHVSTGSETGLRELPPSTMHGTGPTV